MQTQHLMPDIEMYSSTNMDIVFRQLRVLPGRPSGRPLPSHALHSGLRCRGKFSIYYVLYPLYSLLWKFAYALQQQQQQPSQKSKKRKKVS